ncbi:unnamed protein product [Dibothriocephalus latus]|uniref:RRM domain-containing protein n=1 Tax=Dibothriocephalus latus TaxID=60516 RepID=A0A3P7LR80_DIBLA|nr:unnamed protein product [Dibothriocephalus latus]
MTISVRRLKKPTTEADLERYFSKFGDVANVKIVPDGNMGCCGHQGLVKFADKTAFKGGLLEICHFLNGSRVEVTPADIWITKRFGLLSTSN